MKSLGNNIWKYALGAMFIFLLGMFIGYRLDHSNVSSLQGYLYRVVDNSTSTNASSSNASTSNVYWNASSTNASSSNASSSNASNSNSGYNYNIIMLGNFTLLDGDAKAGDKINVLLETSGATLSGATLFFSNDNGDNQFAAPIRVANNIYYFEVPNYVIKDSYHVISLLLVGINSDGSTFSKRFSSSYYGRQNLAIDNDISSIELKDIKLSTDNATPGSRIGVLFDSTIVPSNVRFTFRTADGLASIFGYLKSLDNEPYFEIPSTVKIGEYKLTEVFITSSDGIKSYKINNDSQSEKLNFDVVLNVLEGTEKTYVFDGESINGNEKNDIFYSIYNAPDKIEITINADSNSMILDELFDAIKGTNKKVVINYNDNQIVFLGKDIDEAKTIDASIRIKKVTDDNVIGNIIDDGVVVNFSDNGTLPGKAIVRVKNTGVVKSSLNNENAYIYLYDDASEKFVEVTGDAVKLKDGYYEFEIDHNSSYVMVHDKIDDSLITEHYGKVVGFQKSNTTLILLIIVGLLIVVAALLIVVVMKNRKKEEPFVEENTNEKQ